MTAIVWLRDDLRLDDQPAIRAAADHPTIFLYVHDEAEAQSLGSANPQRSPQVRNSAKNSG